MSDNRSNYRRWKSRVILMGMTVLVLLCMTPLVSLMYTLIKNGAGEVSFGFLTHLPAPVGEAGGIANGIVGSLMLLLLASAFSVPLGIAVGLFLSQRAGTRLANLTRLLLDAMTGIPAF